MSNYTIVILDKADGKLKAIPTTSIGGGGGNSNGYTHTQVTPATVWSIVHGKNTVNVLYQLYDSSYEQIIPDAFRVINPNVVEVTFGVAQTGFVQLITF